MGALLEKASFALSYTDLIKSTKVVLNSLEGGKGHYLIIRYNRPSGVLLSISSYIKIIKNRSLMRIDNEGKHVKVEQTEEEIMNLLDQKSESISVSDLNRSTKKIFDQLENKTKSKFVVMKNNSPAAVLLSVESFEEISQIISSFKKELQAATNVLNLSSEVIDDMYQGILKKDPRQKLNIVSSLHSL